MGGFRIPTMSPGDETTSAYLARRYAFPYGRTGIRGVGEEDPWQPVQTSPTMAEGMALNTPDQAPTNFGGRLLQGLGDLVAGGQVPSFTQSADPAYRAPFLASLLNSGLNAFGAVRRGQAERAVGQNELQQQDFKNRLQVALLNQKETPSQEHVLLKNGNYGAWDPATGTIKDTGVPANTTESRAGAGQYFTDDNGNVTWSPGQGQPAIPIPGARGKKTREPVGPDGVKPTAVTEQRRQALQHLAVLNGQLKALEDRNPNIGDIPWGSTLADAAGNLPLLGKIAKGAGSQRFAQSQLSPDQAEYQRLGREWAQTYLAAQPSSTRALAMQERMQGTFVPVPGTDPKAYGTYRHAREQFILDNAGALGYQGPASIDPTGAPAAPAPAGPAAPASPNSAAGLTNRKPGTPPVDPAITQFYQPKVGP